MRRSRFLTGWLAGGLVFLYAPITLLAAMSFNGSRLTTVWTRFSLRWFVALAQDSALMEAAWLSLRIAVVSASAAMVLGGLAGAALAQLGGFRLRAVFAGLLAAPVVLPDLLIGLALLLLFVTLGELMGWPIARGTGTIILAHTTVGMAFVAVVVEARLAGADRALEEAAMDLGASPVRAFRDITLRTMAPALGAGWLLAFTLSLDDVVIASFVSGPGASTLPMVVFSMLRLGPTPVLNALATVFLGLVGCVLFGVWRLTRGRVAGAGSPD